MVKDSVIVVTSSIEFLIVGKGLLSIHILHTFFIIESENREICKGGGGTVQSSPKQFC